MQVRLVVSKELIPCRTIDMRIVLVSVKSLSSSGVHMTLLFGLIKSWKGFMTSLNEWAHVT